MGFCFDPTGRIPEDVEASEPEPLKFIRVFVESIEDPRVGGRCSHSLLDVVVITFCALLSGAESCTEIADYGVQRFDWLKRHLELKNGIPSHDTFLRVLSFVDPHEFEEAFLVWASAIYETKGAHISLDGKSIAGTERNRLKRPLHLVNVYSHEHGLAIGQTGATSSGVAESPAVLRALNFFDIEGALISVDAGNSTHALADLVCSKGADYLMPIKGNQKLTLISLKESFKCSQALSETTTVDKSHHREDIRSCSVLSADQLKEPSTFKGIRTLIKIDRRRIDKTATKSDSNRNKASTVYYISSRELSAKDALMLVREHWGIENGLHWKLDLAFTEDEWIIRMKTAQRNIAVLRKMAFNLLKQDPAKMSMRRKMKKAAWNDTYMDELLARPLTPMHSAPKTLS